MGNLNIKTSNKYSLITIENWDTYQNTTIKDEQQNEHQLNISRTTTDHIQECTKNGKEYTYDSKESLSPERGTCPHQNIISLYHEILPELPRVKSWTAERKKALRARWKEDSDRQSLTYWEKFFKYVRLSPFLLGENNTNWQPNLEWLIKKKHFTNIIEGIYHRRLG
jgi:hypothetical protein